jgi:uncharacterized membrane protein YhaH (DUF805 family)
MTALSLFLSTSGRLTRRPFAIAIILLYAVSFASQVLLSLPVMVHAHVAPFALAQGLIIWIWYALHVRRLRDAGRKASGALVIAILYGLAIMLLMLLIVLVLGPNESASDQPGFSFIGILVFLVLYSAFTVEASLSILYYLLLFLLFLILTPFLLGLIFSIWAGSKPSAPAVAGRTPAA